MLTDEQADEIRRGIAAGMRGANLIDGGHRRVADRVPAYALYIARRVRVGMTETEARAAGQPMLVGRRPMTRVSRIKKRETQGSMKVVANAENARVSYDVLQWGRSIPPSRSSSRRCREGWRARAEGRGGASKRKKV